MFHRIDWNNIEIPNEEASESTKKSFITVDNASEWFLRYRLKSKDFKTVFEIYCRPLKKDHVLIFIRSGLYFDLFVSNK